MDRFPAATEEMHGKKIEDPYRWLEDDDRAEVIKFVDEQNAITNSTLGNHPRRKEIHKRIDELLSIGVVSAPAPRYPQRQGRYFYTLREGAQNQPVLYIRDGLRGQDRPFIDVNAIRADGTASLDWWVPSEDGQLIAYGVSLDGSEESTLRVREVASGRDLRNEVVERARWATVAWRPDGSGYFYARYPKAGTVPDEEMPYHRKIYYRELGADVERGEQLVFEGKDMKDWPAPVLSPDGKWLAVYVHQGWSKSEVYLRDEKQPDRGFVPIAAGVEAIFDPIPLNDRLLIRTNDGAPRYRLYSVDPQKPERTNWKEIIAEGEDVLDEVHVIGKQIFATYLVKASSRLRVFDLTGRKLNEIELPAMGSVGAVTGQWDGSEAFVEFQSFAIPPTILRYDLKQKKVDTWTKVEAPIDPSGYAIEQVTYPSSDGTPVTMFLVYRKPLERNGQNPLLLYGYGGFNVNLTPGFARNIYLFLERGGVYAVPNLRGGGEYGEAWHRAGMLQNKQNVFDDFLAAARWLIQEKITSPARLAISGRSNGGLLVGAALTQAPELFRAVICGVPLLDMLRYHHFKLAKLWIAEYGSPEDPKAFEWLHAYSPYHQVKDGMAYPAVFLTTAEGDTRVDPMHARKMAARLQKATSSGRPVLLRVERQAGHGQGKPRIKQVEELTDEWTFLFSELGL